MHLSNTFCDRNGLPSLFFRRPRSLLVSLRFPIRTRSNAYITRSNGKVKGIFIGLLCLLAGCNGSLPPAPKEVRVPIPIACITRDQIPAKDFLDDKALAGMDDFQFVISLRTDQLAQRVWIETTSALLEACIK